jgi:glycine/D-amino acid oxidase-like deaminating enzyme
MVERTRKGYPGDMSTDGLRSVWLDPPPVVETDWFRANTYYDDVVIGAGLTGLTTALLLAQAGRRVAVLEARSTGAVTTGHSTAKVTLLQGTRLSTILANHTEHVAGAYLDGNRHAQQWLRTYCEQHGIETQRRDAYTYAGCAWRVRHWSPA